MIYDISPAIGPSLKVWPSDTPPTREILKDMKKGANITLSTIHATAHLGAHADAPSHYSLDGPTIDQRDLGLYLGPCQVIRADVGRDGYITVPMVDSPIHAPRVLFFTGTFDPEIFNEDFAALAPDLIDHLHGHGVKLVGIDTPSADPFRSKDLFAHKRALVHDMGILEGLVLDYIKEGIYELIALPLKLIGFDASPVRAILRA